MSPDIELRDLGFTGAKDAAGKWRRTKANRYLLKTTISTRLCKDEFAGA